MPKQMSKEERAAYQREYRARKKREEQGNAEIELPRVDTPVDMSTSRGPVIPPPRPADWRKRLSPQPDDACVTCHHDRQSTHPDGGACGRGCLCKRFHAAGETVVPCGDCGHDVDQGHATTPCNAWLGKGYCGCSAWTLAPTPTLDTEDPF